MPDRPETVEGLLRRTGALPGKSCDFAPGVTIQLGEKSCGELAVCAATKLHDAAPTSNTNVFKGFAKAESIFLNITAHPHIF